MPRGLSHLSSGKAERERACSAAEGPLAEMGFQVAWRPVCNTAKERLLVQISPRAKWPRESDEKGFANILGLNILTQLWQIPGRSLLTPRKFLSIATLACLAPRCAQCRGRHKPALISGGQRGVRRDGYCKPAPDGENHRCLWPNAFEGGQVAFFWGHIDEEFAFFAAKFYLICCKVVCWYWLKYWLCRDFLLESPTLSFEF